MKMDRDHERQELQDKVAKCYRLAREFPDGITNKNLRDLAAELPCVVWLRSLSTWLNRRAGGVTDFSSLREPEMHADRRPVVSSIIEQHAIRLREQRIDFKGPVGNARQLSSPIPFYLRPSEKCSALATVDGRPIVVKIDQCRE